jgi:hypothetical protein
MDNNERDTHFQGFAKLLIPELDEQVGAVTEWGLEHDASEKEIAQELASRWNTLIAQRAYDLASFAVYKSMRGCSLAQIPDIAEWSTLTENRKFDVD